MLDKLIPHPIFLVPHIRHVDGQRFNAGGIAATVNPHAVSVPHFSTASRLIPNSSIALVLSHMAAVGAGLLYSSIVMTFPKAMSSFQTFWQISIVFCLSQ